MKHLWEIEHPFYGAEGWETEFDSFQELKEAIEYQDEDLNHIYRWDWIDWPKTEYADEDSEEMFHVFTVMPRKSSFAQFKCPISKEQEPEVLEWLKSQRVLGALKTMWAPVLDEG